ncbi:uncharacterized protein PHALS_13109 [Plasmopara halstedii]|uniref:Uncharacterized protein n=1 Tax=Plasmopara halstedii TaxID=4781 RepID=A0A0P1AN10_PLAHL|nr:uncharacterized protein PHALS_13109 [Plasmopara halstedii]CEG42872.1 hypothetical protein PHALS_13109 [Plasmopara halstedii]|eukprot:XP_024579241.1 hypothetical protein PHALS_13109 [Plasmopara halstedii]
MLTEQDVEHLKYQVASALETLLRTADECVSWKQPQDLPAIKEPLYTFLPGIYKSISSQMAPTHAQYEDAPSVAMLGGAFQGNESTLRIILHGDHKFEYMWTMKRNGDRAMEMTVEMEGTWSKPVLNRTRRGQEDNRITLSAQRIRFQRLSNYDLENQTWKLCLKTFTRHNSDWANIGLSERGIPPIVMIFECIDGCLESTGAALPTQILSNSPACRILVGLTKKIANKLGTPVDVMTDKWLPARGLRLALVKDGKEVKSFKKFNPFFCLTDALRGDRHFLLTNY